jgi:F-type H+-transporting ATPase subunit b
MQIDWFTIVAQIVNFLILVGLLKKFLYGPIIRAMDDRERRIASRLEEANTRERQAQEQVQSYREKREDLDRTRDEMLDRAREDAAETRHELIASAREDVQQMQQQWRRALRDEQNSFLSDLRREAGNGICQITTRIMRDLANQRLQDHIVEVFLDRVRDFEGDDREALLEAITDAGGQVMVRTTFELRDEQQEKVTQFLRDRFSEDGKVEFELAEDLICGIELRSGGRRLGWNVEDYLGALGESLAAALQEEVGRDGE